MRLTHDTTAKTPHSRPSAPLQPAYVVSALLDRVSEAEALERLFATPPSDRARMCHFAHAHALNLAAEDGALREAFARADQVWPDGSGIRLAGDILGTPIPHNVNGTDMLPQICARAAREQRSLVFIGAAPGVAARAAELLGARFPGLSVPIISDGFLDAKKAEGLADRLRSLRGAIVLVGMGSPRQELWAWQHLARVPNVTVLTVGGLFDFYADRIPRAPRWLRSLGLEWTFRMAQEPRRLARRYLLGNPLFVARVLYQARMGAPVPRLQER